MTEVASSVSNAAEPAPPHSGPWRWWLAGVLFLATVLTYLDRQTLSVCENSIREEFSLTDEQYGYLLASFRWAYALMQIPAGLMADKLSLRATYGLAVGLWSLAGAAAAYTTGYRSLLVTRAVLGMGETFNWPCASRIVANIFSPSDRSLASGIFNSGAALGSLLAPGVVGIIAIKYGWRNAFFAMGALGVIWLLLWIVATRRGAPSHAAITVSRQPSRTWQFIYAICFLTVGIGIPCVVILLGPGVLASLHREFAGLREIVAWLLPAIRPIAAIAAIGAIGGSLVRWRSRALAFWMLLVVTMTVNPCWYFMNEWMIKYLRLERHLDTMHIAGMVATLVATTCILLVADLGNVLSGGIIRRLIRYGWKLRAARGCTMIVAAACIAPVTLVTHIASLPLAALILALAGMGLTSIIACATACQQDLSFRRVGLVSGVVGTAANIVSALANPQIGAYIDRTKSYEQIFVLMGLLPLAAVVAILVFDATVHGRGQRQ